MEFPGLGLSSGEATQAHTLRGVCVPGPRALVVGVVGAGAQSRVGVWFGSGEVRLPEEAPPPPFCFFLPILILFTPHNLKQALAGAGIWRPRT